MEGKKQTGHPEDAENDFLKEFGDSFFYKRNENGNNIKYAYLSSSVNYLIVVDNLENGIYTEYKWIPNAYDESQSPNKVICNFLDEILRLRYFKFKKQYEKSKMLWHKYRGEQVPKELETFICNIKNTKP